LELRELHRKLGMTFIFVTHDQSEALTMSDRIAVMNRGRIEQIGSPTEVYLRPKTEFVAGFVGQANLWSGEVRDGKLHVAGDFVVPLKGEHKTARALIRPERVRVLANRTSDDDVPVEIIDVIFSGPTIELQMRTPSGVKVEALAVEADAENFRKGQEAFIQIAADDVHVLP